MLLVQNMKFCVNSVKHSRKIYMEVKRPKVSSDSLPLITID